MEADDDSFMITFILIRID